MFCLPGLLLDCGVLQGSTSFCPTAPIHAKMDGGALLSKRCTVNPFPARGTMHTHKSDADQGPGSHGRMLTLGKSPDVTGFSMIRGSSNRVKSPPADHQASKINYLPYTSVSSTWRKHSDGAGCWTHNVPANGPAAMGLPGAFKLH